MYLCIPAFLKTTQQELFALRATMYVSCGGDSYIFWPKMPLLQEGPEWHYVLISDGGAMQSRVLWWRGYAVQFSGLSAVSLKQQQQVFQVWVLHLFTCNAHGFSNLLICICYEFCLHACLLLSDRCLSLELFCTYGTYLLVIHNKTNQKPHTTNETKPQLSPSVAALIVPCSKTGLLDRTFKCDWIGFKHDILLGSSSHRWMVFAGDQSKDHMVAAWSCSQDRQ